MYEPMCERTEIEVFVFGKVESSAFVLCIFRVLLVGGRYGVGALLCLFPLKRTSFV